MLKAKFRKISISSVFLVAVLGACQTDLNNTTVNKPLFQGGTENNATSSVSVTGIVEFPVKKQFQTKASIADMVHSTVSLIYPPDHTEFANRTIASGLTNAQGSFIINPSTQFVPKTGDIFVLEAARRLGGAGNDSLSLRTYLRWNGSFWQSMTTPSININTKTTALAIVADQQKNIVRSDMTIGKIDTSTGTSIPGDIKDESENVLVSCDTITAVAEKVRMVLEYDRDPFHYIKFADSEYKIVNPEPFPTPTALPTPTPEPTPAVGIITTVAGSLKSACSAAPCGDGGQATDAKLYSPSAINIDFNDNVYIAEFSNHAVRVINKATGIISTFAGHQRSGCQTAPCGDGGPASDAYLNGPRGIGVDKDGHIYIADFSNHAIRKVDKNTGIITTVAGTLRSSCPATPCGDGGQATDAKLNSPTRVAFDSDNNMYIADYGNHAIRRVDKNTGIITTYAGNQKSSCATAPCGDGGSATSTDAKFNGPSSIAFDSMNNLYVTEYGNHVVRKIDAATKTITTYAGTQRASCSVSPCGDGGPANSTDARLTSPFSLTVDAEDNVFIADSSNAAIRKVDKDTGIITTVAGIVKSSCGVLPCGEGSPATAAQLSNPFDVKFNSAGIMYILEYSNQALRKVE